MPKAARLLNIGQAIGRSGISLTNIASLLGVSIATVSRYASGLRHPDLTTSDRLAQIVGCKLIVQNGVVFFSENPKAKKPRVGKLGALKVARDSK